MKSRPNSISRRRRGPRSIRGTDPPWVSIVTLIAHLSSEGDVEQVLDPIRVFIRAH
jgi:hypothetical protein